EGQGAEGMSGGMRVGGGEKGEKPELGKSRGRQPRAGHHDQSRHQQDRASEQRDACREGAIPHVGSARRVSPSRHQLLAMTLFPPTVMVLSVASTLVTTGLGSGA